MKKFKKVICMLLVCVLALGMFQSSAVEVLAATKFKVTSSQVKNALNGYSIKVNVNGKEQRFVVKKNEISKLTVKSKKYSSDKKTVTVSALAYIDRKVATVKTTAVLKYKLKGKKWKVSSVSFKKTSISSIKLKGTWEGTYVAGQGQTKAKFVIDEVSKDGYASGTFYFSATPTNPKVPSGSYTVTGGYDKSTGKVTFAGNEWIERPSGYNMVDFYAYVDLKSKKIRTDSSNWSLEIKKV